MTDEYAMELTKLGVNVALPQQALIGEMFPRRHHTVVHPITTKIRADYETFVARWGAAAAEMEAVSSEGESKQWAWGAGGYDYEPARLLPLEPVTEYIYDETVPEWHERLAGLVANFEMTGRWGEEPQPTIYERLAARMAESLNRIIDGDKSKPAGLTETESMEGA